MDNLRPADKVYTDPVNGVPSTGNTDIPDKRKKTLLDYLGAMTREGPKPMGGNVYPVDVMGSVDESLLDEKGLPSKPKPFPVDQRTLYV